MDCHAALSTRHDSRSKPTHDSRQNSVDVLVSMERPVFASTATLDFGLRQLSQKKIAGVVQTRAFRRLAGALTALASYKFET